MALRRLPGVVLPYAGLSFSALQCIDLAVNRYVLSPLLVDLGLYLIVLLLPAALLIGCLRGEAIQPRLQQVKYLGVTANLALLLAVLPMAFRGKDLGAATRKVQVTGQDGKSVERQVPKSEFLKRVAIFYFDNDSGDKELNWVQFAIPFMLELDLSQDSFLAIREGGEAFGGLYKKADVDEFGRAPLALKIEGARRAHLDYVLAGGFKKEHDTYVIRSVLYGVQHGRQLAEHTVRGDDLFPLIDELSMKLKRDVGVPTHHIETTPDLPVGEIMGTNLKALRALVLGNSRLGFHRDLETAERYTKEAVATDPNFALAHFQLSVIYQARNQADLARAALQAAHQNEYRMTERYRFAMNLARLFYDKDSQRTEELLRQWTTLYPEELEAWRSLRDFLDEQNRPQEAIVAAEKLRSLDPTSRDDLIEFTRLYQRAGRIDKALKALEQYLVLFPSDTRILEQLANFHRMIGEHDKARADFQKITTLDPDYISAYLGQCALEILLGHPEPALAHCQRALSRSTKPSDLEPAYFILASYYGWRGMWGKAAENASLGLAAIRRIGLPIIVVHSGLNFILLQALIEQGKLAAAEEAIAATESEIKSKDDPASIVTRLARIYYQVHTREPHSAEPLMKELDALLSGYGIGDDRRHRLTQYRAEMYERAGEFSEALKLYRELPAEHEFAAAKAQVPIGRCQHRLGQLKEAEASLKKGLALWPWNPELRFELAQVYEKSGQPQQAKQEVQAALRIWSEADPEYQTARLARELDARLK